MNHLPRSLRVGLFASFLFGLGGCPIWSGDGSSTTTCPDTNSGCATTTNEQCSTDFDCASHEYCGSDYQCHPYTEGATTGSGGSGGGASTTSGTGGSGPTYCGHPSDCGAGETCAPNGTCEPGDCTAVGCIYGYTCDTEATPPSCKPINPGACDDDSQCASAGTGYKCIDGTCTQPADQCSDQTQCAGGDVCADGKCTPSCAGGATCPTDYTCDSTVQTCTNPASPCTITNDCGGASLVCVDGACVPRSPGGACPSGTVWVENGCIPDQKATFTCSKEGSQDVCATGSICLHHSCYISCDAPHQTACSGLPSFNECKAVKDGGSTYDVCGSSSNLGGDCDPTAGVGCTAGDVCIDGFCK